MACYVTATAMLGQASIYDAVPSEMMLPLVGVYTPNVQDIRDCAIAQDNGLWLCVWWF